MLAKIDAWYSQSSNQMALGALVTTLGLFFEGKIDVVALGTAVIGFFVVALKNQNQPTTVTTTPAKT